MARQVKLQYKMLDRMYSAQSKALQSFNYFLSLYQNNGTMWSFSLTIFYK